MITFQRRQSMGSRIINIYYGEDCLPYKDSERTVHYPITGSSFAGSSNVNELHFYTRDIGGVNNLSWVAIVKLPNGKILYQLLTDIHLDSEINEYYVSFNLSQFYTQLKGDIYISLNGCLGQVEIETDDETNISTIQGEIDSRTVVATGAVKFTINYAPQRPIGYSFDLDQYQTIIQALANKTNIISTFQIVADISTETLTNYEDGQVFYDIATKRFYKKSENTYVDYNFVANNQTSVSIIVDTTTNINGRTFVHFTSELTTISGFSAYLIKYDGEKATEEQAREYMAYMTGSSFLPKYNYDRPANTYFLMPNGLLLKPQYDRTNGLLLFILPQLAMKSYVDENFVQFTGATKDVNLGTRKLIAAHLYKGSESANNELTTKGELDSAIDTIKRNSYINVDLTTYPTLQSFLASEGEEGNIYLYPINTSESPTFESGYYQYIWENNQWQDLGTTKIDLTNYYTKPQTNNLLNGKVDKTSSAMKLYGTNGSGNQDTLNYGSGTKNNYIVQRDSAGQVFVPETPTRNLHATSKGYVDQLIANIKKDSYKEVDTTEYPTLNDFLASTGEEGYLYLYPIDTTDLTKGYYRYVWESNAWLDLGTTKIDLSGYTTDQEFQAHTGNTNNPHNVTKAQVGLGNVDNTSDMNKPVSTAQQQALNEKQNDVCLSVVDGKLCITYEA